MIANFLLTNIGVTITYSKEVEKLLLKAFKEDYKNSGPRLSEANQLKLFELPKSKKLIKAYLKSCKPCFERNLEVFEKKLFSLEDAEELWKLYIDKFGVLSDDTEALLIENVKFTSILKYFLDAGCLILDESEDKLLSRDDAKELVPNYISALKCYEDENWYNEFVAKAKEKGII